MRTTLHHLSECMDKTEAGLRITKESLPQVISDHFIRRLKGVVYDLNKTLFDALKATKDKKLKNLRPVSNFDDDISKLVVTIPEDLQLSTQERNVLAKGLRYIPTPNCIDRTKMNDSVDKFFRRIKLHAYFNDPNKGFIDPDESNFDPMSKYSTKKSRWTPPFVHESIDNFIDICKKEICAIDVKKISKKECNLSKDEKDALRSLSKRDDIVIKRADKGGAIVVWRKDLYISEAERQLSDNLFYEQMPSDLTSQNNLIISKTIKEEIDENRLPRSATNLIEKDPRCGIFYLLPKIHKENNPGRPVISAISCPTHLISAFIDDTLQPLVQNLSSYIKDTTHFLRVIDDFKFDSDRTPFLFTMDVKSLYTVIPNADGLNALKYFLDKRPKQQTPTTTILRLAELVLTLNHFEFDGNFYNQIRGVAMGTKMGPSYACLFMGYIENRFHEQYTGKKPSLYFRYIDDIVGVALMSKDELSTYIDEFNGFHDSINFTHCISTDSITFLDGVFSIDNENGTIVSTIHYKPTDSHAYLRYDSNHPIACTNSIPYSQMLRLRRICSNSDDFHNQVDNMCTLFHARGYPEPVVRSAKERVLNVHREECLAEKTAMPSDKIPLVVPYDNFGQRVVNIIKKNAKILQRDADIGNLFENNIVTAFSNHKNLKSILVRSKLFSSEIPGTFTCGEPRCKMCDFVTSATTFTGPTGSFQVRKSFTCTSTGVVYCILCTKCGDLYIGETGRAFKNRIYEHLRDIRAKTIGKAVAEHFNGPGHCIEDVSVAGLFSQSDTEKRRLFESTLIKRLGTLSPQGLNRIDDYFFKC